MSCSQLMHVVYTKCQPQPAPARPFVAANGGGRPCQDTDEKYDKTLLNHLKILQLTLLFFIRLMKVFRLFGFVAASSAASATNFFVTCCDPHAHHHQQQQQQTATTTKSHHHYPQCYCSCSCSRLPIRLLALACPLCCVWQFHFLFWRPCGGIKGFAYQVINIYKASCTKMTYSKLNIKLNLHKMFFL